MSHGPDTSARLATALRANLMRRKAQARARWAQDLPVDSPLPGTDGAGPAGGDAGSADGNDDGIASVVPRDKAR